MFFFFFSCKEEAKKHEKIEVGQTRDKIKTILSEPDEIQRIEKTTEAIFGPEEIFWDKINTGTNLEVWIYQIEDSLLRLYFKNNEDSLSYKLITPKDVVYETTK